MEIVSECHGYRDLSRWRVPSHAVRSVEELPAVEGESLLSIEGSGRPMDALVDFSGFETTFVSFHAAVSRARFSVPYFTGWSLAKGRANRIALSDPGLTDRVSLSWFAGSKLNPGSMIASFVRGLVDLSGGSRVVLFGGSGGGFAALNYARLFPGSAAVAVNPQTNILRFHRPLWSTYAIESWGADETSAEQAIRRNTDFDLTSIYANGRPDVDIIYVQNDGDQHHIVNHLGPFQEANPDARLRLVMGDWGHGHKAPPRDVLAEVVRGVVSG